MKILVVDDNMENIEMMTLLLESRNHEVHHAMNGHEALQRLSEFPFELIISDILMPVMDGFQLCRECKKDPKLASILFVFYTATYIDKKDEEFALSLGAQKFIRKPVEPSLFIEIIEDVISPAKKRKPEAVRIEPDNDGEVFKLYSERLVNKLEKKTLELKKEIDQHKITLKKLKESEERFTLAVAGSADGIWDWDIASNTLYFSDRYFEMLGYKRNEFSNDFDTWTSLIHPSDKMDAVRNAKNYILGNSDKYESVYRMRTKSGKYLWIVSRGAAVYDKSGRAIRIVGFHTDITKIKEQELELIKAKDKAEESDRLKTAFLRNISHEIRTPMNGILGFINILKTTDIEKSVRDQYAEVIENSCRQLLSVITDIVEISKIDSSQIDILPNPVDIPMIIKGIYENYLEKAGDNKDIVYSIQLGKSMGNCRCITDEAKLMAILNKLMSNAVKYTVSGKIEIGCNLLKSNELRFHVSDTGIGIPDEYHDLIFEKFKQADGVHSLDLGGTGLGLSIARAYVKALGGRMWLESEIGQGSTFYFTIPYVHAGEAEKTDGRSRPAGMFNAKVILVAEDNDGNFIYLEHLFSDYKLTLIRATTGKEAIELCKKHPEIDLVLMDIKLPDIDGYVATKEILKIKSDMPIIAQTAYAFEDDRIKSLEAGCVDYISKPISADKLLVLLNRYLTKTNRY